MAEEGKKFCKHCGELIDKECVICPKCGKQVEKMESGGAPQVNIVNQNTNTNTVNPYPGGYVEAISPKSWLTTLLLCLFLGGLGIHRFYVGKIGTGILMILLAFTGISAVWAVVDCIMIILSKFKDKEGRLVKR